MRKILLMTAAVMSAVMMIHPNEVRGSTYAYSIGVNHGTENEGYDGDFTPNVKYAKSAYATISNMVSSQLLQPTTTVMCSNNPNGNRIIASKIVFLNGHCTFAKMTFDHNNLGNGFDTGVTNSYDGNGCAGLLSVDMSTCKVISFVGCQSGNTDYSTNLVRTAVAQGAKVAVGFKFDITSRSPAGQNWLKKYNDALADGKTVSESIRAAVDSYPNIDMSACAILAGKPTQTVATAVNSAVTYEVGTGSQETYTANINVASIPDVIKGEADDSKYSAVTDKISQVDENFEVSDYKVTVNRYDADANSGVMIFVYYMNGTIETNRAYICTIKNNVVTEIATPATDTLSATSMTREVVPTKAQLCSLVADHEAENSVAEMQSEEIVEGNTTEGYTTDGYVYDYYTNTLIYERKTFYETEDGVICDQYYSEELY